ncbi:MAG: diaminopimelate epimerase [Candidatus Dasytiphilus stammeri]
MQFSKMHSLGNDFMIVDAITQKIEISANLIRKLADRRRGIGFDQFLLVEPTDKADFDFHYRIFNANGYEVEQCGNGARCFARFVIVKKLTKKTTISVSTNKGSIILNIINKEQICVKMNEPNFLPHQIPFITNHQEKNYQIVVGKQLVIFGVVSIGNPHCVIRVDNIKQAPVEDLGSILEKHKMFPEHANIGFMKIINRAHIKLRVFERGVGETPACGSGACAAVAIGVQQGLLDNEVDVDLPGGTLHITWRGVGHALFLTGPAIHVYDGVLSCLKNP